LILFGAPTPVTALVLLQISHCVFTPDEWPLTPFAGLYIPLAFVMKKTIQQRSTTRTPACIGHA
jgi:hypothetical protein